MSGCKISSILSLLGTSDSSVLNGWCSNQYKSDNSYSLGNGMSCTVNSDGIPNYPKGSVFTCSDGSLTSVIKKPDGSIVDTAGNTYKDVGSGTLVKETTGFNIGTPAALLLILVVFLVIFFVFKKGRISLFGKKLSRRR